MTSSIGQDNSEVNADCSPLSRGSVNQSCREQDGQVCENETSEHEGGATLVKMKRNLSVKEWWQLAHVHGWGGVG